MTKYLTRSAWLAGALAVVAAALLLMGRSDSPTASAQNYFNPCDLLAPSSTAANTASDYKVTFGIGLDPTVCGRYGYPSERPGEWNSGGLINFTPNGYPPADPTIPIGAKVGDFKSQAVLGILNNGCNLVLNVNFDLLAATIDQTKVVHPLDYGEKDRLSPLAKKDANGVPAAASGWPDYLTKLAAPEHLGWDLSKVIGRYVGINTTAVTGTTVVLNFLVFAPGATVSNKIKVDPRLGAPAVTVLQDSTGQASASDPVSDFCAPLWTEGTLSGSVGGKDFRKNPTDGVYDFTTYILPAPDADNDGIENGLDPCPYDANVSGWDPRSALSPGQTGDPDIDGIPNECDPHPDVASECSAKTGASNSDEDCDGWQNRGDVCPIVADEDQKDTDGDGIGDACDQNINTVAPETVDGRHAPVCIVNQVTIGSGGAQPEDPQQMQPCNPNGTLPSTETSTPGPTNTVVPGTSFRPTNTPAAVGGGGTGGVGSGPSGGIGSLAPEGSDVPVWAAILAAFGALGLAFGLSMTGARFWRRR